MGKRGKRVYVSFVLTAEEVINDRPSNLIMFENQIRKILAKAIGWLMHEFPNSHAEYDIYLHEFESKIPEILKQ